MKKWFLVLLLPMFFKVGQSQIGINTSNPTGAFHIDIAGNTTASLLPTELKDDFIIKSDGAMGVNVGLGGNPASNTSLLLNDPAKGFLPNRVSLLSALDQVTVSNPQRGMLVYNLATGGVFPDNVVPGIYYYNGTKWIRFTTNAYTGVVNNILLKSDHTLPRCNAVSINTDGIMNFGDITIYEDGGYAFSFRLEGPTVATVTTAPLLRPQVYIFLLRKGVNDPDFQIVDVAELNTPLFPQGYAVTASVVLGCTAYAQDQIQARIGMNTTPVWTLWKNKTTVAYWKV